MLKIIAVIFRKLLRYYANFRRIFKKKVTNSAENEKAVLQKKTLI